LDARAGAVRQVGLSGEGLEAYSRALAGLILAGRLSSSYPDPYACAAYAACLAPSLRRGVYGGVSLDASSGLPVLKDLLALKIDRDLAPAFIASQEERRAAGKILPERAEAKVAYFKDLLRSDLKPLNRVEVRLRRVDKAAGTAAFEVVYDAYAFAPAGFTRYCVQLEQKDSAWASAFLERSGDYSAPTAEFRARLERCAQDESELLFLILGGIPGVRVEEISRARIGPFWCEQAGFPADWQGPREGGVLHFPVDRAAVGLKADQNNDPFEGLYRQHLSGAARDLIEERMKSLGYRVQKDRKFACAESAAPELRRKWEGHRLWPRKRQSELST